MGFFGSLGNGRRGPYDTPPFADENAGYGTGPTVSDSGKTSFFGQGGTGRNIAGYLGDALMQLGGMQPFYAQTQARRQEQERQDGKPYRFQNNNGDVVEVNPRTGEQKVLYKDTPKPDTPGIANETEWFYNLPPEKQQQAQEYMKLRYPGQFVPPTPIIMEPGDVIQGGSPSGGGGAPPVGAVVGGMKFKGGNHRDPKSWEPVGGASPSNGSGGFQF